MYTVCHSIRITKAAEGAVLLALEAGKVLRLNPTGLLILERLQNGATEAKIIDAMTARFQISYEIARADLSEFLEQLQALGIIKNNVATNAYASVHARDGWLS
jgi:hypothetical protein